jgi:hypothetical protein
MANDRCERSELSSNFLLLGAVSKNCAIEMFLETFTSKYHAFSLHLSGISFQSSKSSSLNIFYWIGQYMHNFTD